MENSKSLVDFLGVFLFDKQTKTMVGDYETQPNIHMRGENQLIFYIFA